MITFITATYQRGHLLNFVYQSLVQQGDSDIQWIIVDDGSTDNTEDVVNSFKVEANFEIVFLRQSNSGKHVAINTAADHISRDFVMILDSDDSLTHDALNIFKLHHNQITETMTGVAFRCKDKSSALIGNCHIGQITTRPLFVGNFCSGDLAYIFKSTIFRKYKFPVFNNEKFVPELLIWNKICDHGEILYILDKAICVVEYLADGLSFNFSSNLRKNPRGFLEFYKDNLSRPVSFKVWCKSALRCLQCIAYIVKKKI